MSVREYPEWMYSVPTEVLDPRAARVRELEAALLESNDLAAKLAATVVLLSQEREAEREKEPKP